MAGTSSATNARGDEPFGRPVSPAPDGLLCEKWRALAAHIAADAATLAHWQAEPGGATPAGAHLLALLDRTRTQDALGRIDVINRGVNMAVRHVSDLDNRGLSDQWGGPLETLAAGRGDCEDVAALKYFALRHAGAAESDLRLVLVFDRAIGGHHMVAATRHAGRWVILDNRNMLLLEDRQLAGVNPLFLFGAAGVMQYGAAATRPFSLADRLAGVTAG